MIQFQEIPLLHKSSRKLASKVQNASELHEEALSQNRAKMNHSTVNTTFPNSSFCLYLPNVSGDVRAVLIARIAVNAFTCALITMLNIPMMVAVKTKPQLRTKSNMALVRLSTTNLAVGLVLQPLYIANEGSLLTGGINVLYDHDHIKLSHEYVYWLHFTLEFGESRAIKNPVVYQTQVPEARTSIAAALAWAVTIILSSADFFAHSNSNILLHPINYLICYSDLIQGKNLPKKTEKREKQT